MRSVEYRSSLGGELIAKTLCALIHAAEQTASGDELAIFALAGRDSHFTDCLAATLDAAHAKRPAHSDEMVNALVLGLELGDYVYQVHGLPRVKEPLCK